MATYVARTLARPTGRGPSLGIWNSDQIERILAGLKFLVESRFCRCHWPTCLKFLACPGNWW